jgi:hypothetical protein
MFDSLALPAAAVAWRLDGPPGPHVDSLVAGLIGAGCTAECLTPGTAYRLTGPAEVLAVLAEELQPVEGFKLAHEQAPTSVVRLSSTATPAHAYRRAVAIHGAGQVAAGFVVRAIERGLSVRSIGLQRWQVTGRSADLVQWLAVAWEKNPAEVLAALGLDSATVKAEDAAPTVNVNLPDRRIESAISRNAQGDITAFIQTEKST